MTHRVGRNDPCPCQSGKKFKHCCGAVEADARNLVDTVPRGEPVAGWARAHAVWPKMRRTLLDHGLQWLGTEMLAEAIREFPFERADEEEQPAWLELFISWQLFDWVPAGTEATIAEHWLAVSAHDPMRDVGVARMIESAAAGALSFYQVQAIDRGRGAVLRNLLSDEQRFVVDRNLSEVIPPWTVLFARLLPFGDITMFEAVGYRPLPPDMVGEIVAQAEGELAILTPLSPAELRGLGTELVDLYQSAVCEDDARLARRPTLYTTDKELLVLCRDTWRIASDAQHAVIACLHALGFEADDDSGAGSGMRFRWIRENKDDNPLPTTLLGTLTVGEHELWIETHSRERQARLKNNVETALGGLIVHVTSDERDQTEFGEHDGVPESGRSGVPDEDIPPEVAQQMIGQLLARHYATWPDTPLPACKGKTPRQAVANANGRAQVEAILRDMEYRSHDSPMADAFDFDDLRKDLGLL